MFNKVEKKSKIEIGKLGKLGRVSRGNHTWWIIDELNLIIEKQSEIIDYLNSQSKEEESTPEQKEEWVEKLWELIDVYRDSKDINSELERIEEVNQYVKQLLEERECRAREEGYQNCMDDIWEKAAELRSWTEHDGSVSAGDIEAGLREAYLEIEEELSKLTTK